MIRFLLNRELRVEDRLDPNLTVLDYLRQRARKTGTKEGCASGDCGACTVVVAEPQGEKLQYRTLNACLTFVSALNGKQLITVEDLKQETLHPVQQAMVDCHGSQCGYCTPGFVMSLFALQKNTSGHDPIKTHEALAGNLCRCTGYRPILAAAEQACVQRTSDQFDVAEAETLARLKAIQPETTAELTHDEKTSFSPVTVADLAKLYVTHPQARLLAGGTDLALEVTQAHRPLPVMIYVGHIAAMKGIDVLEDRLEIGAATSLSDCIEALSTEYLEFGELLHRFASLQIRNQATLGGNIGNASPIGDTPPLLLALGARLLLRKGDKTRVLPLEEYFLDYRVTACQPSEFIERILIPRATPGQLFKAYKVSKRLDDDISAVCAAFNLCIENGVVTQAQIAYGGMAAIPKRADACEKVLRGAQWSEETIEHAAEALAYDFTPLTDFRASREYRLLTAQNLLRKCFIETTASATETRVTAYV
ncbi:xanthine dehydrogenase small subunit [Pseudomonas duriflava]|uniref:Xanthine dehydrogenase small subunit n=1 Tax=Pseudomonas duriflava TaxID=459528 RepID=A0A562Q9H8_9PSED|nr:xanthine dehydrogenase small subunit [Pseudomonas duriflava]TWI52820.1 xanthine dehydrogenase small subunit [Pseudomonas duriflava]